jgi:ribA/ribD-fused uncharacterized protein
MPRNFKLRGGTKRKRSPSSHSTTSTTTRTSSKNSKQHNSSRTKRGKKEIINLVSDEESNRSSNNSSIRSNQKNVIDLVTPTPSPKTPPPRVQKPSSPKPPKTYMSFQSNSADLKVFGLPKFAMRRLSNFSLDSVEYEGHEYPSVEHAYQAQKYNFSNKRIIKEQFYTGGLLKTPVEAKSAGGKGGMKKNHAVLDAKFWDNGDQIMEDLIKSKIQKNPEIREILSLLKGKNVHLVHTSRFDLYWGAHMNKDGSGIKEGLNKLGNIYNQYI